MTGRTKLAVVAIATMSAGLYACGGDDNGGAVDGGGDSGTQEGAPPHDSSTPDAGHDVQAADSSAPDVQPDVPTDVQADVPADVQADVSGDVQADAPIDAPGDAPADSPGDALDDGSLDAGCSAAWFVPPAVDPSLAVPADGGTVFLHGAATGTQNYVCTGPDGGAADSGPDGGSPYVWTFVGPQATLVDCNGTPIATHNAPNGPTHPMWTSTDGSYVVGHKLAAHTVDATAIPWLLLSAASTMGPGIMTRDLYVQRLSTTGGLAPASGCDGASVGMTANVPYTADYYFWGN